jgi:MoxR-like ATPase
MRIIENLSKYSGKKKPKPTDLDASGQPIRPYVPTAQIVEAVDLASFLRRPLLLRGEPGCGKSQLAQAVAFELGLNLEVWNIRSTTRADEGLYTYDVIGRLRDAQLAAAKIDTGNQRKPDRVSDYIRFGPIGRAFLAEKTTVILIDEIDKADIDFPNDLLDVLDQMRFTITDTGEQITPRFVPLIFVTSNDEKELSEAFLRRCLFTFIDFPDHDRLEQILYSHFNAAPATIVSQAVSRFLELRARQDNDPLAAAKRVSTSELIDWFRVLSREDKPEAKLAAGEPFPYVPTVIKRREDMNAVAAAMGDTSVRG